MISGKVPNNNGGKTSSINAEPPDALAECFDGHAKQFDNRAECFDEEEMSGDNAAKTVYIGAELSDVVVISKVKYEKYFDSCEK